MSQIARMPKGGKRLSIEKSEWLGDWFISHSPRNSNAFAEGPWDHWVSLALQILQHPATEIVRPEAHAAVRNVDPGDFYDETSRSLTDDELDALFGNETS